MANTYNAEKLFHDLPTTSSECKDLLRFYSRLISSAPEEESDRLMDTLDEIISHLRYRYIVYEQISDSESLNFILYYENHYSKFVLPHNLLVEHGCDENNVSEETPTFSSSCEEAVGNDSDHVESIASDVMPSVEADQDGSPCQSQDLQFPCGIEPLPKAPNCVETTQTEVGPIATPVLTPVPVINKGEEYASGVFQHQIPVLQYDDVLEYSSNWSHVNSEEHEHQLEDLYVNYEQADLVFGISEFLPKAVELLSSYGFSGYMSSNVLLLYDDLRPCETDFQSDVEDDDIKLIPESLALQALRSSNRHFLRSI